MAQTHGQADRALHIRQRHEDPLRSQQVQIPHWHIASMPRQLRRCRFRCLVRNIPTLHTDLDKAWMCTRLPINSIGVQHCPGVVVGAHELVDAKVIARLHHPASRRVTNEWFPTRHGRSAQRVIPSRGPCIRRRKIKHDHGRRRLRVWRTRPTLRDHERY